MALVERLTDVDLYIASLKLILFTTLLFVHLCIVIHLYTNNGQTKV